MTLCNIGNTRDLSKLDTDDIQSYWPFGEWPPRNSQRIFQDWLINLPPNIKYIIGEIPVGGGKSPLALNLSGWLSRNMGDAYLLTPQKILQKQYEDSFEKHLMATLYGKSNYRCEPKSTNCDIGSDIKPRCEGCPHKDAMMGMAYSPNVVLNYSLALNLFKYVKDERIVRRRKLLVFDEAHTLEHHLTEFNAISFSDMRCKKLGLKFLVAPKTIYEAMDWIQRQYIPALRDKISKEMPKVQAILDEMSYDNGRRLTMDESRAIKDIKELKSHLESINEQLVMKPIEEVDSRYVLVNEGRTSFKFKELYGKHIFKELVMPMADRFLFMSSTILDKDSYCSDLGINPDETAFISLPSEFPEDNRPVIFMPTMKMVWGWDEDTPQKRNERKRMVDKVVQLCKDLHPEESGIIHTGSFQVSKWLVEEIANRVPHQVMHHNPGSDLKRDEVINDFQLADGIPKLLISPSITEGLDLKDDKGRFAIFVKVPYPYLGDAWVKKRQSLSNTWYSIQALIAMIQGGGRVVRSDTDWGHVYILDTAFEQLYNRSKYMIPQWWKDAYQVI